MLTYLDLRHETWLIDCTSNPVVGALQNSNNCGSMILFDNCSLMMNFLEIYWLLGSRSDLWLHSWLESLLHAWSSLELGWSHRCEAYDMHWQAIVLLNVPWTRSGVWFGTTEVCNDDRCDDRVLWRYDYTIIRNVLFGGVTAENIRDHGSFPFSVFNEKVKLSHTHAPSCNFCLLWCHVVNRLRFEWSVTTLPLRPNI